MLIIRACILPVALLLVLMLGIAPSQKICALVWEFPPIILTTSNVDSLRVVSDPQGNAFNVWSDGFTIAISRFSDLTETYAAPTTLYTGTITPSSIATDASGTALIIWNDFVVGEILTSFYTGTNYVTPTPNPLDVVTAGIGYTPSVAMDGLGNGLAAWTDAGNLDVRTSFFDGGTQTWGPITTLNVIPDTGFSPSVAYSTNGTAVTVWNNGAGVTASNYNGLIWSAPVVVGTSASNQSVGIDSSGNAVAIWQDNTGELFSAYYTGTWASQVSVSLAAPVEFPGYSFAMSASGDAIAAWVDDTFTFGTYSIFSAGTWGAPVTFALTSFRVVAMDSFNNALIAYAEGGTGDTYSIYIPEGGPAGSPDFVAFFSELSIGATALSDNGRGFTLGNMGGSEGNGISGTFTILPIDGAACFNINDLADRVHIVFFNASLDPAVVAYYIRRNGILVEVILNTGPGPFVFYDHNRNVTKPDIYVVTSVDSLGNETNPLTIILR